MRLSDVLYPAIEPYRSGYVRVDACHRIYFEESGNRNGKPALLLHGGPGAGSDPAMRRFFNPKRYRIILLDQRGAGRSRPLGSLVRNTTGHLVADIEMLRKKLDIERWLVFGGSWGSTLALAYAQRYPYRVSELVLRGIFLARRSDIRWFYQDLGGTAALFPEQWEAYVAPIPQTERRNMLRAYYERLTGSDKTSAARAALAWSKWEAATSYLHTSRAELAKWSRTSYATVLARIECHYFFHRCFLREAQLLHEVHRVRNIPCILVQGRYDVVCPVRGAWDLHRVWPEAELRVVHDAGHSAFECSTARQLVRATDELAPKSRSARGQRSAGCSISRS